MNHRLLIWSAALVAISANVGAIVLQIVAAPIDIFLPVLASVVAGIATFSIIAIHALSSDVRPLESVSPTQLSAAEPISAQWIEQPVEQSLPDDPLSNKPLMKLVEECVSLFDELDRNRPSLDASSQDFADHFGSRLQEILERSGVSIISEDLTFDRNRHQTSPSEMVSNGAVIAETQSPGFAVGRRVFRRAQVKLAEIASTEKGSSP